MKKRSTRMNTARKRSHRKSSETPFRGGPESDALRIAYLEGRLKAARRSLRIERDKWFEKCPKGHLVRHDGCDVTCYVTLIDPLPETVAEKLPAYAAMVETCRKTGLTPLSPEEFVQEDKRIFVEWNRRRHGIDDAGTPGLFQHPCIRYVTQPSSFSDTPKDPTALEIIHEWGKNYLVLDKQFAVDKKIGWWWRVPYGWWLSFWRWMNEPQIISEIKSRGKL